MLNFYGEMLRMLRNRLCDFVKDICKYNNFTHEKTEEIHYIMRVLMYEILKIIIIITVFSIFRIYERSYFNYVYSCMCKTIYRGIS